MGKWAARIFAAFLGIGAALGLYFSFALIQMEGSEMLPEIKPGDYVLVNKWDRTEITADELILCQAPYYNINGSRYLLRRVVGVRNGWIRVGCDADMAFDDIQMIPEEYVIGKVIGTG